MSAAPSTGRLTPSEKGGAQSRSPRGGNELAVQRGKRGQQQRRCVSVYIHAVPLASWLRGGDIVRPLSPRFPGLSHLPSGPLPPLLRSSERGSRHPQPAAAAGHRSSFSDQIRSEMLTLRSRFQVARQGPLVISQPPPRGDSVYFKGEGRNGRGRAKGRRRLWRWRWPADGQTVDAAAAAEPTAVSEGEKEDPPRGLWSRSANGT